MIDLREFKLLINSNFPSYFLPPNSDDIHVTGEFEYQSKNNFFVVSNSTFGLTFDKNNCETDFIWDVGSYFLYNSRFTLPEYFSNVWSTNYEIIIGAIIGGVSYGKPWIPTMVENGNEPTIGVYPNPTNGLLHVSLPSLSNTSLSLFDVAGKEVFSTDIIGANTQLDLSSFKKGIYFLHLQQERLSMVSKIVIE